MQENMPFLFPGMSPLASVVYTPKKIQHTEAVLRIGFRIQASKILEKLQAIT
jgi:hypothetical protein